MKTIVLLMSLSTLAMAPFAQRGAPVTHVVQMRLQDGTFRFEPSEVRAKSGDKVQFVLASGAPHNIAFDAEKIPDALEPALSRVLVDRIQPLAGPMLMKDGATYTITLDGVAPGRYPFYCMPHMSLAMRGVLIVE